MSVGNARSEIDWLIDFGAEWEPSSGENFTAEVKTVNHFPLFLSFEVTLSVEVKVLKETESGDAGVIDMIVILGLDKDNNDE